MTKELEWRKPRGKQVLQASAGILKLEVWPVGHDCGPNDKHSWRVSDNGAVLAEATSPTRESAKGRAVLAATERLLKALKDLGHEIEVVR